MKTLGISSRTFSEDFKQALRRKYWPQIAHDAEFDKIGRKLTDHVADGSVYNTSPAISPSGSMVAFISDRNEYDDVYVISALDGKVLAHLVHGERSGGFESVHPYRGGITWAPDEKSIVMAAKAQGRDVLAQIAFPSGKVIRRLSFGLDGMYSPAFSPNGGKLAFVGLKDGASDIYVYDLKTRQLDRIMADIYEDRDPSFSPSGDTIVFVSDRPDSTPWRPADYAIFAWSPEAGITRLTPRSEYVANPTLLPGKDSGPDSSFIVHRSSLSGPLLAFVGADTGFDLCIYSLHDSSMVLRSSFVGGVYYPTFSRDAGRLVVSYYQNLGWDIASIRDPLANLPPAKDTTLLMSWDTTTYEKNEPEPEQVKPYQFKLTPDYVEGAAGYEGGTGLAGEFDVALSDILGNDEFYLSTDLYGDIQNSDFSLSYWNLRHRLNFSVGIEQYFDYGYGWILSNDTIFGVPYERRNLSLGTTAAYPFDEFTRLEFSPALVASQYQWYHFDSVGNLSNQDSANWLGAYQLDLAYVFDNTFWAAQNAPERGTRARIEAYGTYLPDLQYVSAYVDARNYLKFAKRYIFANRLQVMSSLGRDHEEFYVGGEDVRGYEYQEFMYQPGTNMVVLNSELRSPFIDHIKIAFPLAFDITDIRGVTFADWGMSWNNNQAPVIYDTKNNRLQDLKLGIGYGFRFQVSYFDLMLDYGWPLSALSVDPSTGLERPRGGTWYFGIGTDF
jgi:Tol biopolymer transport system component